MFWVSTERLVWPSSWRDCRYCCRSSTTTNGFVLEIVFQRRELNAVSLAASLLLPRPEPRVSWGSAGPQRLPPEPVLPGCGSVSGETPVPLSLPPAPPVPRCTLLPVRMELAGRVRHHSPQRRGHRQWHCLPRVLHHFRLQGGAGQ